MIYKHKGDNISFHAEFEDLNIPNICILCNAKKGGNVVFGFVVHTLYLENPERCVAHLDCLPLEWKDLWKEKNIPG